MGGLTSSFFLCKMVELDASKGMYKTLFEIIKENNLNNTDKHSGHSYIPNLYDGLFLKYRNEKNTILEIGAREGDSLLLWEKYFHKSKIIGVDNYSDPVFYNGVEQTYKHIESERIKVFIGDAYDHKFVNNLPDLDIVIDDGPHTLESQKKALDLYLPKIRSGGLMVIEDVQSYSNLEELSDSVPKEFRSGVEKVDFRCFTGRCDDLLLVVFID